MAEVEVEFVNETALMADLFWVRGPGDEVKYSTLAPYTTQMQKTNTGHAWRVAEAETGLTLGRITATARSRGQVCRVGAVIEPAAPTEVVAREFRNISPIGVGIYAIEGGGREHLVGRLRPGETITLEGPANRPHRFRSLHCDTTIGLHLPKDGSGSTVEIDLVSAMSGPSITAHFVNDSALSINVMWLDPDGKGLVYHRLAPGETAAQQTFRGHPWLLQDAASDTPLKVVRSFLYEGETLAFRPTSDCPKALAGTKRVTAVLRNLCMERGVLHEVRADGGHVDHGTLDPGAAISVRTNATTPWLLKSQTDDRLLSLGIVGPEAGGEIGLDPAPTAGRRSGLVTLENRALLTVDVTVESGGSTHSLARIRPSREAAFRLPEGDEVVLRHSRSGLVLKRVKGQENDRRLVLDPADVRTPLGANSPVNLELINRTPAELELYWGDSTGAEKVYGTVAPGKIFSTPTFAGHVWRAREKGSGFIAGHYIMDDRPKQEAALTLRSICSKDPTRIRFENRSTLRVDVCWMDFDGVPKHYRTLEAGGAAAFETFLTHPWIVKDSESGAVLDWSWGDTRDARVTVTDAMLKNIPRGEETGLTLTTRYGFPLDVAVLEPDGKETFVGQMSSERALEVKTLAGAVIRLRQSVSGAHVRTLITPAVEKAALVIGPPLGDDSVATEVHVQNASPLTLEVFRIDPMGQEIGEGTLAPRGEMRKPSGMSQPWLFRDQRSGEAVGLIFAARRPGTTVLNLAGLHSRGEGAPRSVMLLNKTGWACDLLHVLRDGRKNLKMQVPAGRQYNFNARDGEVFALRDRQTGKVLDGMVVGGTALERIRLSHNLVTEYDRPDRELWPGEAVFYLKPNFEGRGYRVHGDVPEWIHFPALAQARSVRLGPGTAVTLFGGRHHTGNSAVIYRDSADLRPEGGVASLKILQSNGLAEANVSATSRLTEEFSVENGKAVGRPVLRTIVTLPPRTGPVEVWGTREVAASHDGETHRIDPVRSVRMKPDTAGKLVILMSADEVGRGGLMIRTPEMAPAQRLFVFPDVDLHSKILAMDDDALWHARDKIGLAPGATREDAVHVAQALKALSSTVPAATRSLSHGTPGDCLVRPDRMPFRNWALEGKAGGMRFRPVSAAEIASKAQGAFRPDQAQAQGFFDWLTDAGEEIESFFVETVPREVESAVAEIDTFVTETVPAALSDAGDAMVNSLTPLANDVARTATIVWDETVGWVEQTAGEIGTVLDEGFTQIASGVEDAYDFIVDGIESIGDFAAEVFRVTLQFGERLVQVVVDTFEKVGALLRKVVGVIGTTFEKIVDFLKDIFDFDAVQRTHDRIVELVDGGLSSASAMALFAKERVDSLLDGVHDAVLGSLNAAIDLTGAGALRRPDAPPDHSEALDKLDWLMGKLTSGVARPVPTEPDPIAEAIGKTFGGPRLAALSDVAERLGARLEEIAERDYPVVLNALMDAVDMFRAALRDPLRAGGMLVGGLLSIAKIAFTVGFGLIEAVIDILFEFIIAAIELLRIGLSTPLNIPFLSQFYRSVIGRDLTPLSLLAFIIAVPATILGKLLHGRAPFDKTQAQGQMEDSDDVRIEKQGMAVVYGVCHILLTGYDLYFDITGSEPFPDDGLQIFDEAPTTGWSVAPPDPVSTAGKVESGVKVMGIAAFCLAQLAANPTGHPNGIDPNVMQAGFTDDDEAVRWGHIIWAYQWLYLGPALIDYSAGILGNAGASVSTKLGYGLAGLTSVIGLVHLGFMSYYVNLDMQGQEWSADGASVGPEIYQRRRFAWLMDTFPAITKILTLKEINEETLYIPLAVHCVGFVTLGHMGEGITYLARAGVPIHSSDFDL